MFFRIEINYSEVCESVLPFIELVILYAKKHTYRASWRERKILRYLLKNEISDQPQTRMNFYKNNNIN